METSKKFYSYCFTINNYTDEDLTQLTVLEKSDKVRYLVIGKEVGTEGTEHIQGYIYFKNQVVFGSFKKMLTRAHIEASKGTPEQASDYCKKDGNYLEYGQLPANHKRKGELGLEYWETNKKLAIEGRLDEIDPKLFLVHYRTIKMIQADHAPMPLDLEEMVNDWYYGPTGTGKSYKARSENPGHYLKMCNKWWDGYNNQDVAIIEDFDKNHAVLGHHVKIWADRYSFPAEIKGSKLNLRPAKIIITSNWHPREIWSDPQTLEPILRRFRVQHFHKELEIA